MKHFRMSIKIIVYAVHTVLCIEHYFLCIQNDCVEAANNNNNLVRLNEEIKSIMGSFKL